MISFGLSILISAFILLVMYIICRQKADLCELSLIILAVCIILILTHNQNTPHLPTQEYFSSGVTAGDRDLVYGKVLSKPTDSTVNRESTIIYAFDIINLYIPQTNRRLALIGKQTRLSFSDQPLTYLQKLRIIPINRSSVGQLHPIRFGDPVKLLFTMGRQNDYFVSNDGYLGLTPNNNNNRFQFVNANSPGSTEAIKSGDNILLKIYTETNDPSFINESDVGQLTTNNTQTKATTMNIVLSSECSPNWKFDYSDPNGKLIDRQKANQFLNSLTSDTNQQLSNFKSTVTRRRDYMDQTCMNQLKELVAERALLQAQLDKLKKSLK